MTYYKFYEHLILLKAFSYKVCDIESKIVLNKGSFRFSLNCFIQTI